MAAGKKLGIVIIAVALALFSLIASQIIDTNEDEVIDLVDNGSAINQEAENNFDDDNDGIVNAIDAFPQNPEEWDDFDFDGIGANEDTDDDNDGILDINDPLPSPISTQLTMKYIDLIENCAVMDPGQTQELCYRNFFVSLIDKGESSAEIITMAFFYAKLDIIDGCHTTAHHVGYYSFVINSNLGENILQAEPMCRNGFYHGLLSGFFGYLKTEEIDISNSYEEVCDEFALTPHYLDCIHGLGHGFVVYYDDVMAAVDACDDLTDSLSKTCKFGVMMEYNEQKLTETFDITKGIADICDIEELADFDRSICYAKMGQLLGFLTNHDLEKGLEYCTYVDPNFQELCSQAVLGEFERYEKEKTLLIPFN